MGLFSFIKNAGAKVFGIGKTTEEEAIEAGAKLIKSVETLGFNVKDLSIQIDDETATVSGEADSQMTKEKVILVVGNTKGIGSVDDRMTITIADVEIEAEPVAQFYAVVSGDTLGKIAKSYYGNAMKYPVIFEANKPMLSHPDKIYPGQVLRIPALDD